MEELFEVHPRSTGTETGRTVCTGIVSWLGPVSNECLRGRRV